MIKSKEHGNFADDFATRLTGDFACAESNGHLAATLPANSDHLVNSYMKMRHL